MIIIQSYYCPAFFCVQHYTVSNTLLCPAHYVSNKILCPHLGLIFDGGICGPLTQSIQCFYIFTQNNWMIEKEICNDKCCRKRNLICGHRIPLLQYMVCIQLLLLMTWITTTLPFTSPSLKYFSKSAINWKKSA